MNEVDLFNHLSGSFGSIYAALGGQVGTRIRVKHFFIFHILRQPDGNDPQDIFQ
jgi:hypothetical protein